MGVSRDEVLRVAALARLELSDEEVDSLGRELEDILAHVAALRTSNFERRTSNLELPTSHAERPTLHAELPAAGAVSADGEASGGDALSGGVAGMAPDFRDGFFRVPRLGSHDGTGGDSSTDPGTNPGPHTHTHRERR